MNEGTKNGGNWKVGNPGYMKVPVFDPSFGTGFVAWFDSGFLLGT